MKTVAIVSEYNPFHNGHLYQISEIRKQFGEDTRIIAIMSGNYTQRGEMSILNKWHRAKAAVKCGVNLVFELPFPYSCSSAEFFARAAVGIVAAIGSVDVLSFGSESGDISILTEAVVNTSNPKFIQEVKILTQDPAYQNSGYPAIFEAAYKNVFGVIPPFNTPNNILGIEYIRALNQLAPHIIPHTIKRMGGGYNEESIVDSSIQSATAIRKVLLQDSASAADYMPKQAFDIIIDQITARNFPSDAEKLFPTIINKLIFNDHSGDDNVHDADGGLYNRLINKSYEATSLSSLIDLTKTKKYTNARIRRVIWYSLFGVTSSDLRALPRYTQVLAMDKKGQALLKQIKKTGKLSVLTKPSRIPSEQTEKRQKFLSDHADALFELAMPSPTSASGIYKHVPFILL